MTEQTKETKPAKTETAKEEHDRRIREGRISFLSAGAIRKR